MPVRTLPLLDPSQAQQAGAAAGLPHAAAAATADNNRLPSPITTSGPCPKSGSLAAPAAPASNAFGYAAGEATGGVVAAAVAAAAAAAAAPAPPAVGTPGFSWNPLGVGTPTASKGNDVENAGLGTAGGAGDAWAENDLNDMGEVWTPLAAAVAGSGTEVRVSDTRPAAVITLFGNIGTVRIFAIQYQSVPKYRDHWDFRCFALFENVGTIPLGFSLLQPKRPYVLKRKWYFCHTAMSSRKWSFGGGGCLPGVTSEALLRSFFSDQLLSHVPKERFVSLHTMRPPP